MQQDENFSQPINPDAMYRAPACARLFGIGLSTWWHWAKTQKAPSGLRIGPKTTVWPGDVLLAFRARLIEEAEQMGH